MGDADEIPDDIGMGEGTDTPRRARRERKPVVKEEMTSGDELEDGADDDYRAEEDDEEYGKKRSSRKSPKKPRTPRKRKAEGGDGEKKRRRSSGGGRKKVSEMSEEERERMKEKWREEARLKRARQRETMSIEQREEYLRIQRDRRREQRALAKVTMTEEEREEENKKARERKKAKRATMTPEQRKEEAQKVTLRRIERLANMTEDEKKMWKMNNYLQNMARMSRMTPEEIEERKRQRQEYARKRRDRMTPEDLERRRQMIKQYRDSMTPERRERFLAKLREGYKKRLARLKADPDKWDEVKQKWKEDRIMRKQKMKDMGEKYVRRRQQGTSPRRRYVRKYDPNETPEQKAERIRESRRRTQRKIKLKKKLAMQRLLDSGMSMDEIQQQIETPEQRERRLMRHRVNRAKWNLRKRLEGSGATKEEIEARLKELHSTYQPTFQFRPYKPRPDAWKPVTESDLQLLQEELAKEEKQDEKPVVPKQPKAGPSKAATTTVRRGRPPKNLQAETSPQPSHSTSVATAVIISRDGVSTAPVHFQPQPAHQIHYPQPASSPAGQSTCSYVSAAETPEPAHYPHHQQHHHPPHHNFVQPHHQYTHHNQYQYQGYSQPPQGQSQAYSLQNILDSITFQENGGASTQGPSISSQAIYPHSAAHHHQHSMDGSQHGDYASSYDNHSPPPSSPPHSPGGVEHDYSNNYSDLQFPPPSTDSIRKRGRPRKDEPPRPKKQKGQKGGHRPGPRGPKRASKGNVIRDMVCDECGNAYNQSYLREHKNQFHNPNFKDGTCLLCGEKFTVARNWYTHYIHNHVRPAKETKDKPHMCDTCGVAFRQKNNLDKHKYYMHGEGTKKENFKKCPVCPGEKLFKETVSLYAHLRRKHPGYNRGGHDCYRCEETFPDERELSIHVKNQHGESYFPCSYCQACRFTRLGLNFHYFRCTRISKETRDEMRKQEGVFSLDRVPLPCEFCNRNVAVFSLTRHYWEMHNVKEDNFICPDCGKEFRVREFWAVHMEEKHLRTLDQMKDLVRCLNVKSREGLVIKNPDGVKGGVPGNTPSKAAAQKRMELIPPKKGKKKARPRRRPPGKGVRQVERHIVVMAEEEEAMEGAKDVEGEENDSEDDDSEYEAPRKKKGNKGKKQRRIKVVAEEEGDQVEVKKKSRKKPGPKSKTRKKKESSDEEAEWMGSDEEESSHRARPNIVVEAEEEAEDAEPDYDKDEFNEYRPSTPVDEDALLEAVVKQEVLSDGDD